AHRLEDAVRAALHREMNVRAELRQISERGDEIVAIADGVGRGEADALNAIHFMDGFEKLDEGGFPIDAGKLGAAVEVHDLAEQGDFLHAVVPEALDLPDDVG